MNIMAMKYYETKTYEDYKYKIDILEDTMGLSPSFYIGNYISFYIIDNNRRFFKKHRLSGEILGPEDINQISQWVEILVDDYIKHRVGWKIKKEINEKLVRDWRLKR